MTAEQEATMLVEQSARVFVEYGRFHLADPELVLPDDNTSVFAAIGADLTTSPLAAGPGWVALKSAGNQHWATVTFQFWSAAPSSLDDTWELTRELRVEFPNRVVQIWTVTAGPTSDVYELPEGPEYTVRISVRGQAALIEAGPLVDDDVPDGLEQWLFQFYPAS